MQELMSRHKAYALSPRDCLKTTLFQKWQRMVAPPGKRGTFFFFTVTKDRDISMISLILYKNFSTNKKNEFVSDDYKNLLGQKLSLQ
jgi:hypothetical protein